MIDKINFKKENGLVPCIIQDINTLQVLMLGYMNREAFEETMKSKRVTFFSRSKNRLWQKGEESGNYLNFKSVELDCDNDALLIKVVPIGSTCHTGSKTCWNEEEATRFGVLERLENVISDRINIPNEKSYVSDLMSKGINKVAQKVGEEAVELVIEAKDSNDDLFLSEGADLLFHVLILLQAKGHKLKDVIQVLESREKS
jgi:phosphoribosyl-ATP pyrophosphohydrolase/phosphoribosyl-AMP cyclohydrolase